MTARVLGLNVGHDPCLALFEGGRCTFYEDLARTWRVKHAALRAGRSAGREPRWAAAAEAVRALRPDLVAATLNPGDADEFAAQLLCLARLPEFRAGARAPARAWRALRERGWFRAGPRAYLVEHGLAHVWSAWVTSGFAPDTPVLGVSLDGWSTFGHDTVVELGGAAGAGAVGAAGAAGSPRARLRRGAFPIGGSFFDQYLSRVLFGTASLSAPGKIMGLAQHGRPRERYRAHLEALGDEAAAALPATFRELQARMAAWSRRTLAAFPELAPGDGHTARAEVQDFFATAQAFFTDGVVRRFTELVGASGARGVVYGGGCALSIVTNDRLARELRVPLHIVPCANDTGQAFGAAAWLERRVAGGPPSRADAPTAPAAPFDPFLGVQAGGDREPPGATPLDVDALAAELAAGGLLGWFRGRHAVGPRALGDRSVLASPAVAGMRDRLNRDVKRREWYRPYGAICLASDVERLFAGGRPSPFMLYSFAVREPYRALTRECCSSSGACRVQTVTEDAHPDLCALLRAFERRTGCPLLINTSLNRGGLPIASSIEHALDDAAAMGLDAVVWVDRTGRAAVVRRPRP